jgi:predicted O-methyltransferase YrrM
MAEMNVHPERIGESSWGTRNVLAAFVLSMRPRLFLEIGGQIGCGAVTVGSAMKANNFGRMVCLEPLDHYFALLQHFVDRAGVRDFVRPLQMRSTDPELEHYLGGKPDMIFIDADHSYAAAKRDIELSAGLLAEGGLVFLDDTSEISAERDCRESRGGVRRALLDFEREHPGEWEVMLFEPPFWLNPCGLAMMQRRKRAPRAAGLRCPVCDGDLVPFDRVRGVDLVLADFSICRACQAIVNVTAYKALETQSLADIQRMDSHLHSEPLDITLSEIAGSQGLFDVLARFAPAKPDGVFLDFGAGKGPHAIKAAENFRKSIACDWDTRFLEKTLDTIGRPANLQVVNDVDTITDTVDVLFMWHTLEHLPEPSRFWQKRKHLLADDAAIFLQVPQFRPEHVVTGHYVFYSEASLTAWARQIGAAPVHFGYAPHVGFLSMIAART